MPQLQVKEEPGVKPWLLRFWLKKVALPARGVPETVPRGRISWGAGIRVGEDGSIGAEDSRSGIDLDIGEHIGEIGCISLWR